MKRIKKDKGSILLVLIFFIGFSVALYPLISNYWNSRTQSRAIESYSDTVEKMDEKDCEKLLQEADDYNKELLDLQFPFVDSKKLGNYKDILDVSGTGIMGYVTIRALGVELPIYHGTEESVLQIAAGHLEGSSFPIGGTGTHAVISAHRGLPSAKLFSDLDELVVGDTFTITVLNQTVTYEVDQIRIVLPAEVEELKIDPDKDYCTLMTCTPYGINTHRLLVRGIRTEGGTAGDYVPAGATQVSTIIVSIVLAISMLVLLLILLLAVQWRLYRKAKRELDAGKNAEQTENEEHEK